MATAPEDAIGHQEIVWKEDEQANIAFIDPVSKILIERVFNTDSFVYL